MTDDVLVDPFFSESEFISAAVYQSDPSVGDPPIDINVIFDRENSVTPIGSVAIENAAPQAICKTSDLPDINNKATLEIDGVTYYVKEVQPTANGLTVLILSKNPK